MCSGIPSAARKQSLSRCDVLQKTNDYEVHGCADPPEPSAYLSEAGSVGKECITRVVSFVGLQQAGGNNEGLMVFANRFAKLLLGGGPSSLGDRHNQKNSGGARHVRMESVAGPRFNVFPGQTLLLARQI